VKGGILIKTCENCWKKEICKLVGIENCPFWEPENREQKSKKSKK